MKKTFLYKKETIIPIGFLQDERKPSIFCSTKEDRDQIFRISPKINSLLEFSKTKYPIVFKNRFLEGKSRIENIHNIVSAIVNKKKVITFIHKSGSIKNLSWAVSKKKNEWVFQGNILDIKERGGVVSDYDLKGKYVLYYGESSIYTVFSSDFLKWNKTSEPVLKSRPGFFDKGDLKFIDSKVTEKGILVFYDASIKIDGKIKIQVGAAMFSLTDPNKVIWRTDDPVFEGELYDGKDLECKGIIFSDGIASIYWYSSVYELFAISIVLPFAPAAEVKIHKHVKKHPKNPIISPISSPKFNSWMAEGTFNPAAIEMGGRTHLLFRAIGHDGISRIGYASSNDGIHFDDIHPKPVFALSKADMGRTGKKKRYDPIMYPSGGSWGGCEDPRLVKVDDKIYMTFNAFDNWDNINVGFTSISTKDFKNKKWNWSKPKLISYGRHKNWVLFSEKINGKFALLHNINSQKPDRVLVEYVDDLDNLNQGKMDFHSPDPQLLPNRPTSWHIRMRSAGPPPLKTKDGWLLFYHANDSREPHCYKMGVMLLDLKDPTKILVRSAYPVITPDMWYENDWKPGIVYACGALIKGDTIFIYYGGGDKHVCVATAPLKKFMNILKSKSSIIPTLNKVVIH